jgi:hypothetical protein
MATVIAFMALLTCGFYAYALVRFAREFGWKRQKSTGGIVALPRSTATQRQLDYVHAAKERVRGIAARMRVAPISAKVAGRPPRFTSYPESPVTGRIISHVTTTVTPGSDPSHTAREREMIVSCAIEKDWSILKPRKVTDDSSGQASGSASGRMQAGAAVHTNAKRRGTKDAA